MADSRDGDRDPNRSLWASTLVTLGLVALLSGTIRSPGFASSYLLDLVGPPWIYVLLRGRYAHGAPRPMLPGLTPGRALTLVLGGCALIEAAQYLGVYESTFDPWDFVAYAVLVVPAYLLDRATSHGR